MHIRQSFLHLVALTTVVTNAGPISGSSAELSGFTPSIGRRDYGDIDNYDPSSVDDDGDEVYDFPGVDIKSGSSSYTSSPGTFDGCVWNIDNTYKFTSRLHVANHSWSSANFSSGNAHSQYFLKSTVEHGEGYFNATQVVIGDIGNLRLISNAVPASSSAIESVAAQIQTAWTDIEYGSVRTVAKGDTNAGGVYGFFFYGPSPHFYESDIELLTTWPHNASFTNQYQVGKTDSTEVYSLTNVTLHNGGSISNWHQYRTDWTPGNVAFYIDGVLRLNKVAYLPRGPGSWYWNSWRYTSVTPFSLVPR